MEHNRYNIYTDIINPIYVFFKENGLNELNGWLNIDAFFSHRCLTDYFKERKFRDYA